MKLRYSVTVSHDFNNDNKLWINCIFFKLNQIILELVPSAIKDQRRTKCFHVGFNADTYFITSRFVKTRVYNRFKHVLYDLNKQEAIEILQVSLFHV